MLEIAKVSGWVQGVNKLEGRPREALEGVVVHRIEVSQEDPAFGDGPQEIARF